jgi:hypothetical protein
MSDSPKKPELHFFAKLFVGSAQWVVASLGPSLRGKFKTTVYRDVLFVDTQADFLLY